MHLREPSAQRHALLIVRCSLALTESFKLRSLLKPAGYFRISVERSRFSDFIPDG
jgi:hypothetical protein